MRTRKVIVRKKETIYLFSQQKKLSLKKSLYKLNKITKNVKQKLAKIFIKLKLSKFLLKNIYHLYIG